VLGLVLVHVSDRLGSRRPCHEPTAHRLRFDSKRSRSIRGKLLLHRPNHNLHFIVVDVTMTREATPTLLTLLVLCVCVCVCIDQHYFFLLSLLTFYT